MTPLWTPTTRPHVVLAPMAGYSDLAFRSFMRRLSPHIVLVSEMISTEAMVRNDARTRKIFAYRPGQGPYVVQTFGGRPDAFYETAKMLSDEQIDGIDINMGCPAPKIIRTGYGAALLRQPLVAARCVEALARGTHLPVSIKTRLGWQEKDMEKLVDFVRMMRDAGAKAVSLHGRTFSQAFTGQADWNPIYEVARLVPGVHLNGNGDIDSKETAMARLAAGGWDTDALGEEHAGKDASIRGLMIGRMAVSDPWLVADIANEMAGGQVTNWANAPWESKRELLLYHLEELIAQEGEGHVLGVVRKYLLTYTRGLEGAKALREALSAAPDANALRNLLMQAA